MLTALVFVQSYGILKIFFLITLVFAQMPISQPPAGKGDTVTDKPGSVGCPVATSLAIVSRSHLRPQPYGLEGQSASAVNLSQLIA